MCGIYYFVENMGVDQKVLPVFLLKNKIIFLQDFNRPFGISQVWGCHLFISRHNLMFPGRHTHFRGYFKHQSLFRKA